MIFNRVISYLTLNLDFLNVFWWVLRNFSRVIGLALLALTIEFAAGFVLTVFWSNLMNCEWFSRLAYIKLDFFSTRRLNSGCRIVGSSTITVEQWGRLPVCIMTVVLSLFLAVVLVSVRVAFAPFCHTNMPGRSAWLLTRPWPSEHAGAVHTVIYNCDEQLCYIADYNDSLPLSRALSLFILKPA